MKGRKTGTCPLVRIKSQRNRHFSRNEQSPNIFSNGTLPYLKDRVLPSRVEDGQTRLFDLSSGSPILNSGPDEGWTFYKVSTELNKDTGLRVH